MTRGHEVGVDLAITAWRQGPLRPDVAPNSWRLALEVATKRFDSEKTLRDTIPFASEERKREVRYALRKRFFGGSRVCPLMTRQLADFGGRHASGPPRQRTDLFSEHPLSTYEWYSAQQLVSNLFTVRGFTWSRTSGSNDHQWTGSAT